MCRMSDAGRRRFDYITDYLEPYPPRDEYVLMNIQYSTFSSRKRGLDNSIMFFVSGGGCFREACEVRDDSLVGS